MRLTEEQIKEIKRIAEKAKQTSIEELIYQLESLRNGANVHTINKAIFYLNYFTLNEQERFKYGQDYDRLQDLKFDIVKAIEQGNFAALSKFMSGWF